MCCTAITICASVLCRRRKTAIMLNKAENKGHTKLNGFSPSVLSIRFIVPPRYILLQGDFFQFFLLLKVFPHT